MKQYKILKQIRCEKTGRIKSSGHLAVIYASKKEAELEAIRLNEKVFKEADFGTFYMPSIITK